MAEAFRVDPEALAEAVRRMAEFGRGTETMLGERPEIFSMIPGISSKGERIFSMAESRLFDPKKIFCGG